ncbi:hypothetical protein [Mitsuokella sp. oral taxon 131]|uniref:hypothetical protein n=1 Tax=Mitsuokella sp. oral taxon 131 TaxID=1321780 RepID=UPI0003ADEEC3|nr:hypothetical protein [Mitsuokella sp. oral taxon 131]ERL25249.1 hypothetical protein HMPREF1985_00307 [Mitsuokella sp. oral taxon 131 str. W9106]
MQGVRLPYSQTQKKSFGSIVHLKAPPRISFAWDEHASGAAAVSVSDFIIGEMGILSKENFIMPNHAIGEDLSYNNFTDYRIQFGSRRL